MRSKIFKGIFTIVTVVLGTGAMYTQAAFTDTVIAENNTFSTGNTELKLYYDCYLDPTGAPVAQTTRTYTGGVLPVGDTAAYVECPANDNLTAAAKVQADGEWEPGALTYSDTTVASIGSVDDGATVSGVEVYNYEDVSGVIGDWATTNGWWDGLSSAQDWTNTYPGWTTHSDTADAIQGGGATIAAGEGDILSLGNAGTVPMSDVSVTVTTEGSGTSEGVEPLDGLLDTDADGVGDAFVGGGDRIDPLSDAGWAAVGKTYDTTLADVIYVQVERLDAAGTVLNTVYTGTLSGLVTAGSTSIMGGSGLVRDQVTYLRFNWELDTAADNTYEDLQFDYRMDFTGTT